MHPAGRARLSRVRLAARAAQGVQPHRARGPEARRRRRWARCCSPRSKARQLQRRPAGRAAPRAERAARPPKGLEFELAYDGAGVVRTATVRGPDALLAKLSTPRAGARVRHERGAASRCPSRPEITLGQFSVKGTANAQGLQVTEWDGALLNGQVSGTANVRWGDTWTRRRRGDRAQHQRRGVRAGAGLRRQGRGQRQVLDARRRRASSPRPAASTAASP